MAETDYSTSAVYREGGTGQFRLKGSANIAHVDDYPGVAADIAAAFNLANAMLTSAGINPSSAEATAVAAEAATRSVPVWQEQGTGKIRVTGLTNNPNTATAGSATFSTLRTSINAMLAQLTAAGINPGSGENYAVLGASYATDVYQERDTGKIRVKAAAHLANIAAMPEDLDLVAGKLNDILDLLSAVGLNPEEE